MTYMDGTNTFPIIDDVINPFINNLQNQIDNINYNTSNLITNEYSMVEHFDVLKTDYMATNTIVNNSNIGGEIRFFTTLSKTNNQEHLSYNTKIGVDGNLYVWMNTDYTNPLFIRGWKNVIQELSGFFEFKVDTLASLIIIQDQILQLFGAQFNEYNQSFQNAIRVLDATSAIEAFNNVEDIVNNNTNFIYAVLEKYKNTIGIVVGGGSLIAGALFQNHQNQMILNAINSNINLNQTEKDNLNIYTSNVIQGKTYDLYNKGTSNLNEYLGFTTQKKVDTITNDILNNFIDTNQTNTINYSSLNSYPSKIPTTIYTTSTQKILGQWNAKKRFNLDYTGISYGIGDYYLYYNTASTNTFINCFDGNNNTYGEFSSIYTANVYDDFLNSQNVYSLGDFTDRGNVLIIQLPYKISLNSITIRSASNLLGAPINYSIYGANDLDVFYKLHQTIDLTPATDYPSPNYTNTQTLSQDSKFYNTFGFIFKKAYQQAPRIYEIKLYGYEILSRRTLIRNNVGIGTNDPLEKLHLVGDFLNQGNIYTNNLSTSMVLANDKIGVGTINPLQKLHIVGGNILCDGNTNTNTITINSINNKIYFNPNGNIGIGISNLNIYDILQIQGDVLIKSDYLTINNTNKGYIKISTGGSTGIQNCSGKIEFYNTSDIMVMSIGDASVNGFTTNYLDIVYNSPIVGLYNRGHFLNSGNIGIGFTNALTNPSEKLEILGNIKTTGNINVNNLIYLNSSGNIGIGITNPTNKLEVSTTAKFNDITLSSYIDCYRNTTNTPQLGIYGGSGDRIILKRGTISTYPYSIGIGNNHIFYSTPQFNNHIFYVNGVEKVFIKASGMIVNSVENSDILSIYDDTFTKGIAISNNSISSVSDVADNISIKSRLTGNIYLNVNGNNKLTIFGVNGNIGINTSSANYNLDINGSLNCSSLYVGSITSTNSYDIYYANPKLTIKSTGQNETSTIFLATPNSSTSALKCAIIAEGINSYNRAKLHFCLENTANIVNPTNNASLSNSRMTITNDGYVGIGTTIPITNLEVFGSINATSKYLSTNTSFNTPQTGTWGGVGDRLILWQGNTGVYPYSLGINAGVLWYSVPSGSKHSFFINGIEYLTINSGGSLNVVSADTYIAQFKHTNLSQGIGIHYNTIEAIGTNATQDITIKSKSTGSIYFNTNGTNRAWIDGSTNTFNVNTNSYTLYNVGNSTLINNLSSQYLNGTYGSANVCSVFGSTIWCNGTIFITSDERVKKDIIDLNGNDSLNKILKLKPKSFKYIDNLNNGINNNYGFIAQDIKEIIPEAISYQKNFIPNIYELCFYNNYIITTNKIINNILKIGDIIKIFDDNDTEIICTILEIISDKSFKIDKKLKSSKVFVYGIEVDDFNVLDKEMLFSINISATKELFNIINNLEKRINKLEKLNIS